MARVRVPTVLRPFAGGVPIVNVDATSIAALRRALHEAHPALADRLYDESGRMREFVSVFIDGEDARDLGDDHGIAEGSEIVLLPAVSGGA